MEDSNIAIRLKGFIDSQGLTHSQFADTCQIPRPSLSQILSGRNKKISDVIVGQVHRAFPNLSILWLLFGEGEMISSNANSDAGSSSIGAAGSSAIGNTAGPEGFDDLFGGEESLFSFVDDEEAPPVLRGGNALGASRSSDASKGSVDSEKPTAGAQIKFQSNLKALNQHPEALKRLENEIVEYKKQIRDLQSQIEKMSANPRKVMHITVYYEDSTYETFYPRS